jgi:hypothetical protein
MDINEFINDDKIKNFINYLKNYQPENSFIIQDSEFTRRNIARRYSANFNIYSSSIEKKGYSLVCKNDLTAEYFTAKELLKHFSKPLIITGMGLYGEMFIKELRLYEKILNIPADKKAPIIIYGSPGQEKLEKIKNLYDLYIDNTDIVSVKKLDWIFSLIASYLEK